MLQFTHTLVPRHGGNEARGRPRQPLALPRMAEQMRYRLREARGFVADKHIPAVDDGQAERAERGAHAGEPERDELRQLAADPGAQSHGNDTHRRPGKRLGYVLYVPDRFEAIGVLYASWVQSLADQTEPRLGNEPSHQWPDLPYKPGEGICIGLPTVVADERRHLTSRVGTPWEEGSIDAIRHDSGLGDPVSRAEAIGILAG